MDINKFIGLIIILLTMVLFRNYLIAFILNIYINLKNKKTEPPKCEEKEYSPFGFYDFKVYILDNLKDLQNPFVIIEIGNRKLKIFCGKESDAKLIEEAFETLAHKIANCEYEHLGHDYNSFNN